MKNVLTVILLSLIFAAQAQVNTGSNGSDGVFNPSIDTLINMGDHPNGIYQFTSVNIPTGVKVTFIPNANNTPVYWLVQGGITISGTVSVNGQSAAGSQGALGGPGGYAGGNAGNGPPNSATGGQGPGGGNPGSAGMYSYGNAFLIPLLGGSGGGGIDNCGFAGGGGGGAILIAAANSIVVNGAISADGGPSRCGGCGCSGGGSGGAIRLIASQISGTGFIGAGGASPGRIRLDTYDKQFTGSIAGQFTSGFQPIIIPAPGQIPSLHVTSVAGVPVSATPTGQLFTPDAVVSPQQLNPVLVVVNCANLPLHSLITVTVKPASGSPVSGTGYNDTGSQLSSTASASLNLPRGGGLIYATATTGN